MATKRKRGSSWEYVVRRSKVLPKPIYLTFDSEHSGDEYVGRLEALIDRGLVPPEFLERKEVNTNVQKLITDYVRELSMPESDKRLLDRLAIKIGGTKLTDVTYPWVEKWVSGLKRVDNLAPGTIRHYVGAFARCLDWAVRRGSLVVNPLRMLPRRYATYTANDGDRREDEHRERRLSELEEKSIRKVIESYGEHIYLVFFDLALETAMRMREMFTLSVEQVDLEQRTVFLSRTKNGDNRQVPLSSVALRLMKEHLSGRKTGLVFPFWNGSEDPKKATSRLSRQYRRFFLAAECMNFHFHDTRHEATSRIYERTNLGDIEISRITGHKDLRTLRRYSNLRGSELAKRLW